MTSLSFRGATGKLYEYWIVEPSKPATHFGGNYLFIATINGQYQPVFAGEGSSVFEALSTDDAMQKFAQANKNYGLTIIGAHLNPSDAARIAEWQDLIKQYRPPLNFEVG